MGTTVIQILEVKRQRHREANKCEQGQAVRSGQSWGSKGPSALEPCSSVQPQCDEDDHLCRWWAGARSSLNPKGDAPSNFSSQYVLISLLSPSMVVSRKRFSGNALMVLFLCLLSSLGHVDCDVPPGRLFLAVWKDASSPPSYLDIPLLHWPHQGTWHLFGTQIHLTLLVLQSFQGSRDPARAQATPSLDSEMSV